MPMFNDREVAFESKFAHDAEVRFHEIGRRNRLLGAWVAGKLGLTGQALADYVASIVHEEVLNADDRLLVGKVVADLARGGHGLSEGDVAEKMQQLHDEARLQLKSEPPPA